MINYEHFAKMELRVGKIVSVEDIEGKDKVYKLSVDVGGEKSRTIVAGLKPFYTKEELQDKMVIVVANLEPKKLAGFLSEGMLLAASEKRDGKEIVALLQPDKEVKVGSKIY